MRHYFPVLLFSLISITLIANIQIAKAQEQTNFQIIKYPLAGEVNVPEINTELFFSVQPLEMPAPGSGSYRAYLMKLKQNMPAKIYGSGTHSRKSGPAAPHLKSNFEGNLFNGHVPNDNDLAVSNDGRILSVVNSSLYFFNRDSMTAKAISLSSFAGAFPQTEGKYDPKVLYDPDEDRFILTFLNGFDDSTSFVFMAFSKTNDPAGEWNIYTLSGNPLHDTSWSDFPMIALTKDELFFTINLLRNRQAGDTWKNTFKQTIIWQIDKKAGFRGDSLITKLYSGLQYENVNLRNVCPVQEGSRPGGPNMYFLSNRNFSLECDSFYLLEISGKLDDPKTKLNIELVQADKPYGVPPLADQPHLPSQPNWKKFETNDSRVLDAYFEKDRLYFVGNTVNFKNNFASFYQGKVTGFGGQKILHLEIMDDPSVEFGYPSITYTGENNTDEHLILVNHSSDSINPGVSSFFYSGAAFSDRLTVKEGETKVSVQGTPEQRWGDYTGLQRKYNEKGVAWGCGYWGKKRSGFPSQVNATWIAELVSPTYDAISTKVPGKISNIYPIPASQIVHIDFKAEQSGPVTFSLLDMSGKKVKLLGKEYIHSGMNRITMTFTGISSGNYILIGQSFTNGILIREKVIVN